MLIRVLLSRDAFFINIAYLLVCQCAKPYGFSLRARADSCKDVFFVIWPRGTSVHIGTDSDP